MLCSLRLSFTLTTNSPVLSASDFYVLLDSMAFVAHERTDLQAVAEIEASPDVLGVRTNAGKVVRVPERFVVKIGYSIHLRKWGRVYCYLP